MIPYGRQAITEADIVAVEAVLRFEQAVATKVGAAHGVAVNSANCGRYCGARVDFVDIDPRTYNLSVEALTAKLEQAEQAGRLPKILIPVHFAGQPCDMPAIAALAERYDRLLADLPVRTPWQDPRHHSALHLYPIQVADGPARASTFRALRDAGIGVNGQFGFARGDFPVAEDDYARAISLPLFPTLSESGQDQVIAALQHSLG